MPAHGKEDSEALAAADWEPDYRPTQGEVASLIRAVVRVDRIERDNS